MMFDTGSLWMSSEASLINRQMKKKTPLTKHHIFHQKHNTCFKHDSVFSVCCSNELSMDSLFLCI